MNRLIYAGTLTTPPYAGVPWDPIAYISATATSYTDTAVVPNRKYQYRIYARNSHGNAAGATTAVIYTAPAAPTAVTRTTVGADQKIDWVNNVAYDEYAVEVWHAVNGVWDAAALPGATSLAAGTTTFTHLAPVVGTRHSYRVIAKTTSGTVLYSAYSAETDSTAGTTIAPDAPTNLVPASPTVVDYSAPLVFTWKHNPADGSAQTAYSLQHRVAGGTWTVVPKTSSATSSHTLSPNPYSPSTSVEWQVQTWGSDTTLIGAMSAITTFTTSALVARRYPVYLDVSTGQLQADSAPPPEPVVPAPSIDPATSCVLRAAASQTLVDNFTTTVTLATVGYNVGCDVSVANTIKIVTPGLYVLAGSLMFDSGGQASGSRRMMMIYVNGVAQGRSEVRANDNLSFFTGDCVAHVYLNKDDLVTLQAFQNGGTTLPLLWATYPARLSVALMANQGAQGPKGDRGDRGAPSAAPLVEAYTTPGSYTWTRTSGAVRVEVIAISGGAGGGSGRARGRALDPGRRRWWRGWDAGDRDLRRERPRCHRERHRGGRRSGRRLGRDQRHQRPGRCGGCRVLLRVCCHQPLGGCQHPVCWCCRSGGCGCRRCGRGTRWIRGSCQLGDRCGRHHLEQPARARYVLERGCWRGWRRRHRGGCGQRRGHRRSRCERQLHGTCGRNPGRWAGCAGSGGTSRLPAGR